VLAYFTYRAGAYFSRVLPWKLPEAITWTIGQVSCLARRKTRKNVEGNLQIIHGGALSKSDLRRMSRRVIMNFSRAILVFLKLTDYRWDDLAELVDFDDLRVAAASLGERKAFLLASIHMGPWELGGLCLSRFGFKVHTVALDHPTEQVTRFFDERRRSIGVVNHPLRKSYSALKGALESGDCVALLVDRAYGATAKRFDFFGVEHKFPMGHLLLAGSTGVPIFTGALVFAEGNRFKYIHAGVHYPPAEGTEDFDKLEGLQKACLRDFEGIIRDHYDQWFQFFPLADPREGEDGD
jgi:KDO2-lipid IV(A) lauroyltransferase